MHHTKNYRQNVWFGSTHHHLSQRHSCKQHVVVMTTLDVSDCSSSLGQVPQHRAEVFLPDCHLQ